MQGDKRIGIIGQGYVGTAIKTGFEKNFQINTYDKFLSDRSTQSSIENLTKSSDLIFLCLPTPMNSDGSCHLNILLSVLYDLNQLKFSSEKVIIIKSTVPPGSTDNFKKEFSNLRIVYNPEFLREANFIEDFKKQKFIILGGEDLDVKVCSEIYNVIFPNIKVIKTTPKVAEMTKNLINTFLATKVSFANEIKLICDKSNINYEEVIKIALNDNRLGNSHWDVPGPDLKLGFGGSCFPKDINSLMSYAKNLNIECNVIDGAIKTNNNVRLEKDWEKMVGRAVADEKK